MSFFVVIIAVKEICTASPVENTEEKDWFEKSLDEFTIESEPENEEDEAFRGEFMSSELLQLTQSRLLSHILQ